MRHSDDESLGEAMYALATELYPICRSITGQGLRQTLQMIQAEIPELQIHEVPSGTQAFDWTVPDEWNIRDGYVLDESGKRIIDFKKHNLHVMGYSEPVDLELSLEDLQPFLHSLPSNPDAIPYVTSYYERRWGFCLSHRDRMNLAPGRYRVRIDSTLEPGSLTYGDLVLPGREEREVLLSTYVCHPSLANNELSGPVVTTALVQWLKSVDRRFTYRIVFAPESIGAIVYLSRHAEHMKPRLIAGFIVTCVGDDRAHSMMPSRRGDTLADRVARHVLGHHAPAHRVYSFLERGSDERQYCSPRIDLPVVSIMRSKYSTYPEYHTSLDDLRVISPRGLLGGYRILRTCLKVLESNHVYRAVWPCEPQLGRRDLYPTLSTPTSAGSTRPMVNFLAYADGKNDLISIAQAIGLPADVCASIADTLESHGLIERLT